MNTGYQEEENNMSKTLTYLFDNPYPGLSRRRNKMTNKSKSIMNLRLLQNNWFLPKQSNFATCAKYQVRYWGGVKPKATPVRGPPVRA